MDDNNPDIKKPKRWVKPVIISIICLLVVTAVIITVVLLIPKTKPSEIDSRSFEEIFWASETANEAIETFQQKINATSDPEQKANLYLERKNFLFDRFEPGGMMKDQILSDSESADELINTPESANELCNLYIYYQDEDRADYYREQRYLRTGDNQ